MKVIVAGDYCANLRIKDAIVKGQQASIWNDIPPILKAADYAIANFEFPVIGPSNKPIPKCGPTLGGDPSAVDAIAQAGFNIVTIANNHILDHGEESMKYTINLLKENGLKVVGVGENIEQASLPLIVHKDGNERLGIINCCEHEFSIASETQAGACPLNPIQQWYEIKELRNEVDYILVIVHGGHEHYQLPSPRMKETYRFFIDAGADAVVNHHQHCYSGYEIYNGKPIFYGLGNFLFDHPTLRNCRWNEGFFVELDFLKGKTPQHELYPYTQCNDLPEVKLMQGKGLDEFKDNIAKLNLIIADNKALKESFENFAINSSTSYKAIFEPYSWRPLSALYWRHMLPSFLTQNKKYRIMNYLNCESHLDRLRYIISKL
ncbi:CapA family protein [Phocaeicola salanitronis]|uniref:CapA family protein n=1 Tax=Phocaeicola salanitronis TaxID=376805 RepID=UPI00320AC5DF